MYFFLFTIAEIWPDHGHKVKLEYIECFGVVGEGDSPPRKLVGLHPSRDL